MAGKRDAKKTFRMDTSAVHEIFSSFTHHKETYTHTHKVPVIMHTGHLSLRWIIVHSGLIDCAQMHECVSCCVYMHRWWVMAHTCVCVRAAVGRAPVCLELSYGFVLSHWLQLSPIHHNLTMKIRVYGQYAAWASVWEWMHASEYVRVTIEIQRSNYSTNIRNNEGMSVSMEEKEKRYFTV